MASQIGADGRAVDGAVGGAAGYDSTGDTLRHSLRVGALMAQAITELVERSVAHDLSKVEEPERAVFDEFVPRLRDLTYGTPEYLASLETMGSALLHHYRHNRHHPEHFTDGINGMTLIDLIEMLADWKAAGERQAGGHLAASLRVQQERFGIGPQLMGILRNTAEHLGWLVEPLPRPRLEDRGPALDSAGG